MPLSDGLADGMAPDVPLSKGLADGVAPDVLLSKGLADGVAPDVLLSKGLADGVAPEAPEGLSDVVCDLGEPVAWPVSDPGVVVLSLAA